MIICKSVQDNTLTVEYARDAKSFLESVGVKLSYHEYEMGHQVNENVMHDLVMWLNK